MAKEKIGIFLVCWLVIAALTGCAQVKPEVKPVIRHRRLTEDEKILRAFSKDKYILIAFEKAGFDRFTIAKYLNEYREQTKDITLEGFFTYLKQQSTHISEWALDALFTDVRMNYELIKQYEGVK